MHHPKITIPAESILSIPPHVAKCPYCDGALSARFSAWTECKDGRWKCDGVELECERQPELDEDAPNGLQAWREFNETHTVMPYVYWLPVCDVVERWVNRFYRFEG